MLPDDRYRRAAAAGGVGIWDWNIVTGEVYIDPVLKEMLGYQDDEIPNTADVWHRLVHPDDKAALVAWTQANIAGDSPQYEFEHRMLHRDGSVRWFLARASVTRDAHGAAIHMAGTDTDITARKRGEEALRQAEEINRRIAESTGDCVKILDLAGRIIYINPEGLRQLELDDPAALLNAPLEAPLEGEARLAALEAMEAARGGGTGRFQFALRTGSGALRSFDIVLTPITDASGAVVQLLAVSRDITERRREEAFRATQHQVLGMIATGSDLADVLDLLVRLVEQQSCGMRCSVLLLDDDGVHVRHGAAPSLPEEYVRAIDGMAIGPRNGSCGTAMFLGTRIIVTDILNDPLWADYRDVALQHRLRACWSTPIFSPHRKVLGSFAMYYDEPRTPSDEELRVIESAAEVARIAIEQQRAHAGAAPQRSSQQRHPAGDSGLDVPDHGRGRLPRLPRQGPHGPARASLQVPWTERHGRASQPARADARAGVRTRGAVGRTREGRVRDGARRQRALLRSVCRALRRRQDSQHRPGHHRSQAGGAGSQRAAARDGALEPGRAARRAHGCARARIESAADGCSQQRAGRAAPSRQGRLWISRS